jgi:hypothetical protein
LNANCGTWAKRDCGGIFYGKWITVTTVGEMNALMEMYGKSDRECVKDCSMGARRIMKFERELLFENWHVVRADVERAFR